MVNTLSIHVKDLSVLTIITKGEMSVLIEVIKMTETTGKYKGVALLNSVIRKDIALSLNIRITSLNNALNTLCKKSILQREDTNMYRVNSEIFTLN